ncbi:hypothetical protein F6V25_15380 [Oryzomonas japonica]|uniref:Uncharacterized protein n=1 Tax=Oryzomonas japonica TaxID=2603858 RepID=A0A7J4ZND7_9BACT|nr:hypothetical protein [Oryzomonas japonica]KAB0663811.1 hypothetical protein F6V25_15380 [Oryzomonas japonica]
MPTTDRKLCREAIRKTLVLRAGDTPDASAVAEAALGTWRLVAIRLTPVIGTLGVDVLFKRSLHLTSTAFPWLSSAWDHEENATVLASLKARLEACEKDAAAEASYTLLVTFTELLATLIGESLTERLLGPVWASSSPVPEQESIS